MTVEEMRLWLAQIPEEYNSSQLVWRVITPNPDDSKTWVITDESIAGSGIDVSTNDMYFCDFETANIIETSLHGMPQVEGVDALNEPQTDNSCDCEDCDCKK